MLCAWLVYNLEAMPLGNCRLRGAVALIISRNTSNLLLYSKLFPRNFCINGNRFTITKETLPLLKISLKLYLDIYRVTAPHESPFLNGIASGLYKKNTE